MKKDKSMDKNKEIPPQEQEKSEAKKDADSRIKSPDELLLKMLSNKSEAANKLKEYNIGASKTPEAPQTPTDQVPQIIRFDEGHPFDHVEAQALHSPVREEPKKSSPDVSALKKRFADETSRWKEYEQNVNHWKDKVLQIVRDLRTEVEEARSTKQEVPFLKQLIQRKDEEIEELKKKIRYLEDKIME